jgi:hypothetical protein
LTEARAFERASGSRDIEALMRMALQGRVQTLRRWAAVWLREQCNVVVVFDEAPALREVAPPRATSLTDKG